MSTDNMAYDVHELFRLIVIGLIDILVTPSTL